jgi:serine/threonine protein phosphatase 1
MTDMHAGRLYVIGDIHGRLDLLNLLIDAIHHDVKTYKGDSLTVTLGDYIDRGPSSRGVLNRLLENPFPNDYVALKGNHEALLEAFLKDPKTGDHWRQLGGLETLHSFGIPVAPFILGERYDQAAEQLRAALTASQLKFLKSLRPSFSLDRFFLCHAGVRPDVPLDQQIEADLLWIRDEFLDSNVDFGKIVIHGHTPVEKAEFRPNRINIDTGAFATGQLTCLVVEGARFRTINT